MTARILPFPDFFRPASPWDEMGTLLILESRSESNQRQTRNGWGQRPRKMIYHRDGLRVGEADAVRPATSEFMDVTAGETALNSVPHATPACAMGAGRDCNGAVSGATGGESAALIFPRECPKVQELRRNTRRLCKNFNWQFSGSES